MDSGFYSEESKPFMVPGYVKPLEFVETRIDRKVLHRFQGNYDHLLNFKWVSEFPGEYVNLEISDNRDFKDAQKIRTKEKSLSIKISKESVMFIRGVQEVDAAKYNTQMSEITSVAFPGLESFGRPELQLPAGNENFFLLPESRSLFKFSWRKQENSLGYDIEIARDEGFKKILQRQVVETNSHETSQKLGAGRYYWRVRSFDRYQESPWSEPRRFTVIYGQ